MKDLRNCKKKYSQMKWAGHMIRRKDERLAKNCRNELRQRNKTVSEHEESYRL